MEAVQENMARCVQAATQEQLIAASRVAGDVTISGVSMKQGMNVNMQCLLGNDMQSAIQSDMASKIAQYAETNGIALLSALGSTAATAEAAIQQIFTAKTRQVNTQEAIMQNVQRQGIKANDIGGKLIISDITMAQTADVIAKAIVTSSGYASAISTIANAIDNKAAATETGPLDTLFAAIKDMVNSTMFMFVGLALVGGLVFIFFMKYLFTTDTGAMLVKSGTDIAAASLGAGLPMSVAVLQC